MLNHQNVLFVKKTSSQKHQKTHNDDFASIGNHHYVKIVISNAFLVTKMTYSYINSSVDDTKMTYSYIYYCVGDTKQSCLMPKTPFLYLKASVSMVASSMCLKINSYLFQNIRLEYQLNHYF